MTQLDYETQPNPLGPENRKTVLLVWGILLIILGGISGCLAVFTPLALIMPAMAGQPAETGGMWQVLMAVFMYGLIAVALIWIGIGSIRAQRWVRPIVLVLGTLWLVTGVMATLVTLVMIPAIQGAIPPAPAPGAAPAAPVAPPPTAPLPVMFIGVGCVAIMFVVLPGAMLWFYRDPAVRTTLEFYDPQPRWTDRVPIPVLGMSLTLALLAIWLVPAAAVGTVMIFGWIASGPVAIAITLLMAVAFALAAWWSYRRRPAGWWLAVALVIALSVSVIWSMLTVDFGDLYTRMGFAPAEVDAMVQIYHRQRPLQVGLTIVLSLAALGYAIYVRKWFNSERSSEAVVSPPDA